MAKSQQEEETVLVTNPIERPFFNYRNRPPKVKFHTNRPTKTQESPLDAKSPQEVLLKYGMYRDGSALESVTPFYADLTEFSSYEEQLNNVRDIREKFSKLDVDIRAKFNHSPEQFCNYITSKDFDIKEIMNSEQLKEYQLYIENKNAEEAYEKYKKSPQYQKDLEEQALQERWQKESYEKWKKEFGGSN